jgi:hypothetical protein
MAYPHRMAMHRWATRAPLAGLTTLAVLALSACGSSSSTTAADTPGHSTSPSTSAPSSSTPSAHVRPASGPVLSAGGFSFHAPKGWADVTDQAQAGVLLYAANPTDENPLMITVRHRTRAPGTVTAAAKSAAKMLAAAGGTNIEVRPTAAVGGNRAAHVLATQAKPGSHYQLDAYYVLTGQDGWVIMFATNQYTTASRRQSMLASVLATCHWRST